MLAGIARRPLAMAPSQRPSPNTLWPAACSVCGRDATLIWTAATREAEAFEPDFALCPYHAPAMRSMLVGAEIEELEQRQAAIRKRQTRAHTPIAYRTRPAHRRR
jgi:hypothetical protein